MDSKTFIQLSLSLKVPLQLSNIITDVCIKHAFEKMPPTKSVTKRSKEKEYKEPKTAEDRRKARERRIAESEDPKNKKIVESATYKGSILLPYSDKIMVSVLVCLLYVERLRKMLCKEWNVDQETVLCTLTSTLEERLPHLSPFDITDIERYAQQAHSIINGEELKVKARAIPFVIACVVLAHSHNITKGDRHSIKTLLEVCFEMYIESSMYLRTCVKERLAYIDLLDRPQPKYIIETPEPSTDEDTQYGIVVEDEEFDFEAPPHFVIEIEDNEHNFEAPPDDEIDIVIENVSSEEEDITLDESTEEDIEEEEVIYQVPRTAQVYSSDEEVEEV